MRSNIIGTSYRSSIRDLKRQLLLFDKIIWPREWIDITNAEFEKSIRITSERNPEIEWLIERGFLEECEISFENMNQYLKELEFFNDYPKWDQKRLTTIVSEFYLRAFTLYVNENNYIESTPILSKNCFKNRTNITKNEKVVGVIIKNLPFPDEMTPWEQIMDFKKDQDNKNNLIALKRWINKISRGDLNVHETEDEVEYLIKNFEKKIKYHNIKKRNFILKTFINVPLEILENIIKIKWGKISDSLFSIIEARLELLEAESMIEGRELAYIVEAKDTFR